MSTTALLLVLAAALLHASWNFVLKKKRRRLGHPYALAIIGSDDTHTHRSVLIFAQNYSFTWAALGMIAAAPRFTWRISCCSIAPTVPAETCRWFIPLARATGPLLTIVAATLYFGEHMTSIAMGGALLILISTAMVLTGDPRKIFSKGKRRRCGLCTPFVAAPSRCTRCGTKPWRGS